jgi:hypothetical protein
MNATELPYQKITGIPFPGDKLTFNELSANILLDENMDAYNEMYAWIRRLLDEDIKNPLDRTASSPPSYSDITLHILSSANTTVKKIRYLDCVPTSLGDISFESTGDGTTFITFVASFRFSYFELV